MKCIRGGFVDQNCKCICPDGSNECTAPLPGEKMKVNKPTGESQLTVTGLVLKFILKESALQNRAVNNPIKIILE